MVLTGTSFELILSTNAPYFQNYFRVPNSFPSTPSGAEHSRLFNIFLLNDLSFLIHLTTRQNSCHRPILQEKPTTSRIIGYFFRK